eukprot:703996_1
MEGSSKDTFIIDSKSKFCSVRINAAVHSGKYYYKVRILETDADCPGFYIGWADQGFIPNDAESRGVGNDCSEGNSWASNGLETWHDGKQNDAFNANMCVCGERLELRDAQDCYSHQKRVYCRRCPMVRKTKVTQWFVKPKKKVALSGDVWHCPKGSCDRHMFGYDICLKHATPHEGCWVKGDQVGCCIDIDKGEVSYYLDDHFVGIAFKNITFKEKQLFPALSMFNNQRVEMIMNCNFKEAYHKVPEPELYCPSLVHKDHYDEILANQYVLRSRTCINDIGVYQFGNMNDLHFIIPCKTNVPSNADLNLYVQSPHHNELILLKTFERKHLTNYKTQHLFLQYILDFLEVYDRKLDMNNIKRNTNQAMHPIDFFGWNHNWISVLLTPEYRAILKQPTPLGVDIYHRLIHELRIESVDRAFKVLETAFVVQEYPMFEHFTLQMKENADEKECHEAFSTCDYALMKRLKDDEERQLHRFKHNEVLSIRGSGNHETYVVYVRNEALFGSDKGFELQTFALNCSPSNPDLVVTQSIYDSYLFANNLEIRDVHHVRCIGLKRILNESNNDEYMKIKAMILRCKFVLMCDETKPQLTVNELRGRNDIDICQFEEIETVQFALTPLPAFIYALYVQLEPDLNSDFVLIKTFEKDMIWKPMPPQYKPSHSTGVYGAHALTPPHRYRPSLSTGVYGVHMLQLIKPLSVICSMYFMDYLVPTDDNMFFTLHAHNVDCIHHNAILNATYLMVFQDEIDHKATMMESDGIIYQFDDINHMRFVIPFGTVSQYAHLYVKSKTSFDFVFVKRLQIEKRDDITNEIDYLLIALKRFDVKITNPKQFGCDVERLIPQMIQNPTADLFTFCDKYDSTKRILDRLYEEFDAQMLLSHRTILSTKFQCVHASKAFGYCVYKTHKADGDDAHTDEKTNIFESSKYEIVCIRNHDMQSETKQTKILDFGDELIITNRDEYDLYVISVQNEDVFNSSQYIEIQRLNKPDFSECSNAFRHHLQLMDKTIELKAPQGDYGRYDVTEGSTSDTFIINSKSKFCSIRINAALHSGKYYYEVHILKADEDCPKFYIGWADQGFIPNDAESRGVGNDCSEGNSWACNGMETWHNGKQNEAF